MLAYDGAIITQIDAGGVLDIAMAGKWESALLVNVDSDTLRRMQTYGLTTGCSGRSAAFLWYRQCASTFFSFDFPPPICLPFSGVDVKRWERNGVGQ